jgi:hypothetical protein
MGKEGESKYRGKNWCVCRCVTAETCLEEGYRRRGELWVWELRDCLPAAYVS